VYSCPSEVSRRTRGELHKQAYEPQFWSIRQRKATLLSNQAWQAKRSRIMKHLTRQCENNTEQRIFSKYLKEIKGRAVPVFTYTTPHRAQSNEFFNLDTRLIDQVLLAEKLHGIHYTRGCVGFRAGLSDLEYRNKSCRFLESNAGPSF